MKIKCHQVCLWIICFSTVLVTQNGGDCGKVSRVLLAITLLCPKVVSLIWNGKITCWVFAFLDDLFLTCECCLFLSPETYTSLDVYERRLFYFSGSSLWRMKKIYHYTVPSVTTQAYSRCECNSLYWVTFSSHFQSIKPLSCVFHRDHKVSRVS